MEYGAKMPIFRGISGAIHRYIHTHIHFNFASCFSLYFIQALYCLTFLFYCYILAALHATLWPAFHVSRWVQRPSLWVALHPWHHGVLRRTCHSSLHHVSWGAASWSHEGWVPLLVNPCKYNNKITIMNVNLKRSKTK